MFPSIESAGRRFAFLHRVLRGEFPCFNSTIKALRLPAAHPAALRCLRLAVPRFHSLLSLLDGRVRRRGLELVTRYLRPGLCRGNDRTSQVPVHNASFVTKCEGSPHSLIGGNVKCDFSILGSRFRSCQLGWCRQARRPLSVLPELFQSSEFVLVSPKNPTSMSARRLLAVQPTATQPSAQRVSRHAQLPCQVAGPPLRWLGTLTIL